MSGWVGGWVAPPPPPGVPLTQLYISREHEPRAAEHCCIPPPPSSASTGLSKQRSGR